MDYCKALSRSDTADRLAISVRTLDTMIQRGEIRAVRYSGRVTIPLREVLRLLGELEPAPSPPALSYSEVQEQDAQE